jgi:phosphate transport system protein
MLETAGRPRLTRALDEAETAMLDSLELVRGLLARAVDAALEGDPAAAEEVGRQAGDLAQRHLAVHEKVLTLIACQSPVAGDLRLAMALLHINDRIERMGSQCLNIATLCCAIPTSADISAAQHDCLKEMARLTDEQLAEAARVFAEQDVEGALALREHDAGINGHNRRCFQLAVHDGTDEDRREGAFCVAMMARALERVGDNAVDIGRQLTFVATGRFADPAKG